MANAFHISRDVMQTKKIPTFTIDQLNEIFNFSIKNMYIKKLDDIVYKCSKTYYSQIKMKPLIWCKWSKPHILNLIEKKIRKILNLKSVIR